MARDLYNVTDLHPPRRRSPPPRRPLLHPHHQSEHNHTSKLNGDIIVAVLFAQLKLMRV
jgi:hypothetical protein